MSAGALSELYDELDAVVRELSEELVLELARRDELEYEKELKNQFIALLLSIQRRQRELIDSKRRGASSAKATEGAYGGNQPGCVSYINIHELIYLKLSYSLLTTERQLRVDIEVCK